MRKDVLRRETQSAIRRGLILVPDNCHDCGANVTLDCHHDGYDDPMDVVFLCYNCHLKRHTHGGTSMSMVLKPEATCCKCGYTWQPRVEAPASCPSCKRQDWNDGFPKKRDKIK